MRAQKTPALREEVARRGGGGGDAGASGLAGEMHPGETRAGGDRALGVGVVAEIEIDPAVPGDENDIVRHAIVAHRDDGDQGERTQAEEERAEDRARGRLRRRIRLGARPGRAGRPRSRPAAGSRGCPDEPAPRGPGWHLRPPRGRAPRESACDRLAAVPGAPRGRARCRGSERAARRRSRRASRRAP